MKRFTYLLMLLLGLFSVNLAPQAMAQSSMPQVGDKITTEDGIYLVTGENLISNPVFENGFDGWTNGSGGNLSESNFTIDEGDGPNGENALRFTSNGGSSSDASLKTGWQVTTGKTYVFSIWGKRTSSGMSTNTEYSRIFVGSSATSTSTQIGTLSYVADTWNQTNIVFTAEQDYVVLNIGWSNSATSITAASINEVEITAELATTTLEETISEAETLLSETTEGTERGQYTAAVRATLQAAIDEAKTVLTSATTQDEINEANTTLSTAISTYKEDVVPPFEVGEKYTFTNVAAGLLLNNSDGVMRITAETCENNQVFSFVNTPDDAAAKGWNLVDQDGSYVYRSGSWDTYSSTDADLSAANAIWQVIDGGDYIQLKNMGSGSVMGTDATTDGSAVYSNKNGTDSKFCWTIQKFVPESERDEQYYFELALADVEAVYNAVDASLTGTRAFMINATAYAALGEAIAEAKTMTDYAAAQTLIEEAAANFEANLYNAPVEGQEYSIIHLSELTLHNAEESAYGIIVTTTEETEQKYVFEESGDDGWYYLKNVATGLYLSKNPNSDWLTMWTDSVGDSETQWRTYIYAQDEFVIQCRANSLHLGTDVTTDSAIVYCDKAASLTNSHWNVTDGSDNIQYDLTLFNAALDSANNVLSAMTEGYAVGEYYASDIAEFRTVISSAQTQVSKAESQEAVDSLAAQLLVDIETYKAKAHTESVADEYLLDLANECQTLLDGAVVGIQKGEYYQESVDAFQAAIDAARATTTDFETTIETLTQARADFLASAITVDRSKLTSLITTAANLYNSAEAGDCDGQYAAESIEELALSIQIAEAASVDASLDQEGVDTATDNLQEVIDAFKASVVKIDFSALQDAIQDAQSAMTAAESYMGDGAGKYPESAFTTLQEAIATAQEANGSTELNQEAVNEAMLTLIAAVEAFEAERVPNDYSELSELLATAQAYLAEFNETGSLSSSDLQQLISDIEKGQTAMSSTDQDEIDRAARLLKRDITLYSQYTGIANVKLSQLSISTSGGVLSIQGIDAQSTITIYAQDGRTMAQAKGQNLQIQLTHGIYVVKLTSEGQSASTKVLVK